MKIAYRGVMLEPTRLDIEFIDNIKRFRLYSVEMSNPYYCTIYDLMRAGF